MLHYLIAYLYNSTNHTIEDYTFPYIDFPSIIHYSYINYFMMMLSTTITSDHSMNISTVISGCKNGASTSYIYIDHHYSSWDRVSPIMIHADVYVATGKMTLCI